ncbi:carboxymuconolactone decarboxylase family protein [Sessilibacter corallicola]|uniref:carboxymuconolactone decarboxylase family protein n=1 Tax=Sessilibacter corallicola TaxID=2904075 RepID=UPI001E2A4D79|nr:carboxymuconolactone decarboxylase family protein [Sessilibacter corallicola]MCE2028104.1 carboxymuconolactone decarboxylase family protein [Sessilibacter corallicola]
MERIGFADIPKGLFDAMMNVEEYIQSTNIDYKLLELVRLRASQINGCAYCVDMHYKEAGAAGESLQRLYSLSCWRETNYYSDKERAVLDWVETVTTVEKAEIDEKFNTLLKFFDKNDIANLTLVITSINSWNRLMVTFGIEAGNYQVAS